MLSDKVMRQEVYAANRQLHQRQSEYVDFLLQIHRVSSHCCVTVYWKLDMSLLLSNLFLYFKASVILSSAILIHKENIIIFTFHNAVIYFIQVTLQWTLSFFIRLAAVKVTRPEPPQKC